MSRCGAPIPLAWGGTSRFCKLWLNCCPLRLLSRSGLKGRDCCGLLAEPQDEVAGCISVWQLLDQRTVTWGA